MLARISIPTDLSPYFLVGSASGTTLSLGSILYQLPAGGWVGAVLALASLAGNLYLDREKRRRREAEEARRIYRDGYRERILDDRLDSLERAASAQAEVSFGLVRGLERLEGKLNDLASRPGVAAGEICRPPLRGRSTVVP